MRRSFRPALGSLARYGIFVALLSELILFSVLSDDFFSIDNQLNVLRQNAAITIVAAGMTFVILTGGIDLSVGSLMALAAVACAEGMIGIGVDPAAGIPLAVLVGILASAVAGLANGFIITRIRIPPFVTTLAMMTMARGLVLHHTDSRTIHGLPESFGRLGNGALPIMIMLLVIAAAWLLLMRTPFGRHVYAVGGNRSAAHLCGIRVHRVLLVVYLLSGALAGLGGVLMAARLNVGDPKIGQLYELDAIAAVVVGGTSLMGGRGSIWGTLAGALVIGELNNFLSLRNVPYYSQKIVIGVVLILAAFLDRFRVERD
ncbi:MAG: ABC transporter permease [Planctomycetota bacterium]